VHLEPFRIAADRHDTTRTPKKPAGQVALRCMKDGNKARQARWMWMQLPPATPTPVPSRHAMACCSWAALPALRVASNCVDWSVGGPESDAREPCDTAVQSAGAESRNGRRPPASQMQERSTGAVQIGGDPPLPSIQCYRSGPGSCTPGPLLGWVIFQA